MSEGKIKQDEVIEKDLLVGTIEQGRLLLETFEALEKGIKSLAVESTKYFTISIKTLADLEKRKDALGQITALEKAHADIIKQKSIVESQIQKIERENLKTAQEVEKLERERIKTDSAQLSLQQKLTKEAEKANKTREAQIKNTKILNSVHEQEKKQLKNVSDRYKELIARGREGTVTGRLLKTEFDRLDKSVRKAEQSVGQFNRSVGDYKNQMVAAIKETGLFSGKLGQIINSLKAVRDAQDKTATGAKALGNAFKLTGIGLVLVALAALKTAFDAAAEFTATVAEKTEIASAALKGFYLGAATGARAFAEFTINLIQYRKEIILLRDELQKVSLDQADFLDISNDTTIGFKERTAALQESIRLGNIKAEQETQLARMALGIVDAEIAAIQKANGGREVAIEFLQKRAEALHALNEAEDRQSDLLRENAQLERKLAEERTTAAIDLLLKSKQSANARKVQLEKELADERVQLEQRKKAALELAQVNTQTTNEEIRIFKEGFKVKFDANKLVNEQDAVKLKQMIEEIQFLDENNKMVGLGVEAQKTLAMIVAKFQKENLEYLETKKKLEDEELRRTQRLAQIDREIGIAQQADDVQDLQRAYEKLDEAIQKNFDKLIDSPFSRKLQKQRELQLSIQKQQAEDLFNEEVELLKKKAEADIAAINNTITDEKIKAAEILKIQKQLQIDLGNLQGDELARQTALNDEIIKQDKKLAKERMSVVLDSTQKITEGIADGLQKRAELQQQADQKDIDMRERMLEVQMALAAQGKENVLGETLAAQAQAEEKKIQDAKKAAKQQETLALIQTFQEVLQDALKADKPFLQAFGEALAASGVVSSTFSKLFAGFYEGTEDTGTVANPLDNKGGRVIIAHDNERIIPKRLNKELDGISNDELVQRALAYPDLTPMFFPKVDPAQTVADFNNAIVKEMANEIKALRSEMAAKPVPSFKLGDKLGEYDEQWQSRLTTTIIHHKKSQTRPSLRLNG